MDTPEEVRTIISSFIRKVRFQPITAMDTSINKVHDSTWSLSKKL